MGRKGDALLARGRTVSWSPEEKRGCLLKPVRGYGLVEEVVGKGWQDIIFPWFSGLEE